MEDNAEHKIQNVTVQGFKFGIFLPEMTNASFIHVSNCEYALCFLDCTHVTTIEHLSTHNNRRQICVLPMPFPEEHEDGSRGSTVFGCEIRYRDWNRDEGNNLFYKP